MAQLLPAALWEELEPLFPSYERSVLGGRPPAEHRVVLTAILFVLKTGIAWEDLPLELGCSYKTCKRRLTEWIESGLWRRLHEHLLAKLQGAGQIDWSRALLDSSHVKAPLGGEKWGRAPLIGAGRGVSITC